MKTYIIAFMIVWLVASGCSFTVKYEPISEEVWNEHHLTD